MGFVITLLIEKGRMIAQQNYPIEWTTLRVH